MKQLHLYITLIVIYFLINSCSRNCKDDVDTRDLSVNIKVEQLEKELFSFKSKDDVTLFLKKYPLFSKYYLEINPYVTDAQMVDFLFNYYSNKQLHEFYLESENLFGDINEFKNDLERGLKHIKYYYPQFYTPAVYTLVSGFKFEKDILVNDSVVVVSIDYFLGKKARYRPAFYDYFLERFNKPYLVPMLMMAYSDNYNKADGSDNTMLAEMIFYGKAHYFMQRMLPCAPDSMIIMYPEKELEDVQKHELTIWEHFIQNKLLFNTQRYLIDKYVGEAPKVHEIGERCPGRIGRWLGWQIVRSYMEHNSSVTLPQLMAEKDAQKIFNLSKYKPKEK